MSFCTTSGSRAPLAGSWASPTRRRLARCSLAPSLAGVGVAAVLVVVPAATIAVKGGMPGRLPSQVEAFFAHEPIQTARRNECVSGDPTSTAGCTVGSGAVGAIVIGDSHAARVVHAVHKAIDDPARSVLDWTLTSCPTTLGVQRAIPFTDCAGFLEAALAKQKFLPKDAPLIVMNRLTYYAFGRNEPDTSGEPVPIIHFGEKVDRPTPEFLAELKARVVLTACAFAKTRPVYLVRPIPEMGRDVPHALWLAWLRGGDIAVSIPLEEYRRRHAFVVTAQDEAQRACGVQILDPVPFLCSEGRCLGAVGGQALYADDDHLSAAGADLLVPMFGAVLRGRSGQH